MPSSCSSSLLIPCGKVDSCACPPRPSARCPNPHPTSLNAAHPSQRPSFPHALRSSPMCCPISENGARALRRLSRRSSLSLRPSKRRWSVRASSPCKAPRREPACAISSASSCARRPCPTRRFRCAGWSNAIIALPFARARLGRVAPHPTPALFVVPIPQCGASGAVVLPKWTPPAEALGGEYDVTRRTTEAAFCRIDAETTAALRSACRAHGLTVSAAVNAAAVLCASDVLGSESDRVSAGSHAPQNGGSAATRRFKLLQVRPPWSRRARPHWNGLRGTFLAGMFSS